MLCAEGIPSIEATEIARLAYLRAGGQKVDFEKPSIRDGVPELIAETEAGLVRLLALYANADHPYRSWAIREREDDKGDYDLLARVKEWSTWKEVVE